jgi:hypothetical protein
VRTTLFSPSQSSYHTDQLGVPAGGTSGIRISTTARYDNDSSTYTIPTLPYTYDEHTAVQTNIKSHAVDRTMSMTTINYGVQQSFEFKKFGNGSLLFPNRESGQTPGIFARPNFWSSRTLDTQMADFTIEMWVSYWDAAAGGKAINASGSYIFHYG